MSLLFEGLFTLGMHVYFVIKKIGERFNILYTVSDERMILWQVYWFGFKTMHDWASFTFLKHWRAIIISEKEGIFLKLYQKLKVYWLLDITIMLLN